MATSHAGKPFDSDALVNPTESGVVIQSDKNELSATSDLAKSLFNHGFESFGSEKISKTEALIWAAKSSHSELVRQLLSQGTDVNAVDETGWTALNFATNNTASCEVVEILLTSGANLDARSGTGEYAAIHYAAWDAPESVRLLITHGASVETQSKDGSRPLHLAAKEGCVGAMQILLDANANVDCLDEDDWTPLHYACRHGRAEAIRLLISSGASIASRTSPGNTPLHLAAYHGHGEVVNQLIHYGADVQARTDDGTTTLHWAIEANSLAIAQTLLDNGIDIECQDTYGDTPLSTSVKHNVIEMTSFLLKKNANTETAVNGDTPLHLAATRSLRQMMQLLIESGASMEARDINNRTPLLEAARTGKIEVVRLLADLGADVRATDKGTNGVYFATMAENKPLIRFFAEKGIPVDGRCEPKEDTALMKAATQSNPEIASLLIRLGTDVNATDNAGWTPLHYAASLGHKEIVEILLQNGADPTVEESQGLRPFHLSKRNNHESVTNLLSGSIPVSVAARKEFATHSIVALLRAAEAGNLAQVVHALGKGVPINSVNIDGRSSLSLAAEHGWHDIVLALMDKNADLELKDGNGSSPLWWASRYGHQTIVKHLLDQGVNIDTLDADGQSALSASSQQGHLSTAKLLLDRGADPNSSTVYGKTPLLFAVTSGWLNMVELLLEFGADVNHKTAQGDTAMSLAKARGHQKIADAIESSSSFNTRKADKIKNIDDGPSPGEIFEYMAALYRDHYGMLTRASMNGRLAMIQRLIALGVDPNTFDGTLPLPLFTAAVNGQVDAAAALVKHGAVVDATDSEERSALHYAACEGYTTVVKLLHSSGASIHEKDKEGKCPLLDAARAGHEETALLLLQLGASTESKDSLGKGPLWHATSNGHKKVVTLLVEYGANIESADHSGCTPLMIAVQNRDRALTRFFLDQKAQMRPEPNQNYSPLCSAAKNGDEAIVDLLLDYGADVDYLSDNKRTALHIATLEGNTTIVKMLIEAGAKATLRDADGRTPLSLAKERPHDSSMKLLSQASQLRQNSQRAARKAEEESLNRKVSYQYRPLTGKDSIRVLELHPGSPGDVISFDLIEIQLSGADASFEALSYEWKEKYGSVPVQCGNEQVLITPNCKAAIENLRLRLRPRYLWIDAVCINQEDDQERNQQVAMMADIFRTAEKVLMWLGQETESTSAVFKALPTMAKAHQMILGAAEEDSPDIKSDSTRQHSSRQQRKRHLPSWILAKSAAVEAHPIMAKAHHIILQATGEDSSDTKSKSKGQDNDPQKLMQTVMQDKKIFEAFERLAGHSYWTRAWILQEIIIGDSRGVIICGSQSCQWTMMRSALLAYHEYPSTPLSPVFYIGAIGDYQSKYGEITLSYAIWALYPLKATDPRDKVFASLSLATIGKGLVEAPSADYTMTVEQVFVHATRYIIDTSSLRDAWNLGIRHSTKELPNLPSWVPDFMLRQGELEVNPFKSSEILCGLKVSERPISTPTSLQISGAIVDKVVFKITVRRDLDPYQIISSAIHALLRQGRSIYDVYPGVKNSITEYKRHELRRDTNAAALLTTMSDFEDVPASRKDEMTEEKLYSLMVGFITWSVSKDKTALEQCKQVPTYATKAMKRWTSVSDSLGCKLKNIELMEDMLRYDKDLVYTAKGYFGMTNGGEAEEGMSVALIGKDNELRLLRKCHGPEPYYQYVDMLFLNCLGGKVDDLQKAFGDIKVERLELR